MKNCFSSDTRNHTIRTMGKPARNDITHDKIKTKASSDAYRTGWERIFKKKKQEHAEQLEENVKKEQDEHRP